MNWKILHFDSASLTHLRGYYGSYYISTTPPPPPPQSEYFEKGQYPIYFGFGVLC